MVVFLEFRVDKYFLGVYNMRIIIYGGDSMRVNITMDEELLSKVDEAARKMYVSRSAYIAFAVSQKIQSDEVLSNMPKLADALQGAVDVEHKRLASRDKK